MDVCEHQAYLAARVLRVVRPEHKVRQVALQWAREQSGCRLLFETLVLIHEMSVKAVAGLVGEDDERIWSIVHHYVDQAVDTHNLEGVERVGIDETWSQRGRQYVSVFADRDERRGMFCVEGRDHVTVRPLSLLLDTHGGDPEQVTEGCQDMSETFLKGTLEHLPEREITLDRYHLNAHPSKAFTDARREESQHHRDLLKNTQYMWREQPANLTEKQRNLLDELPVQPLETVRACSLSKQSGSFYEVIDLDSAEEYLRHWITEVNTTGLEPLQKFARMLEGHWQGVTGWHHNRINNGLLEGPRSLIRAVKRRAKWYPPNHRKFIAMICLSAGRVKAGP